tara:strand:- start:2185 stop:2607 length:423 start_codon:yes stop_codon:yes gene_type:complete
MKYYKIEPASNDKKVIIEEKYVKYDNYGNEAIIITLNEVHNTGNVVVKFDSGDSIGSYNVDSNSEDGNFSVATTDEHYVSHAGTGLDSSTIAGIGVDQTQLEGDYAAKGKSHIVSTYGDPQMSVFKISGDRTPTDVSSDY